MYRKILAIIGLCFWLIGVSEYVYLKYIRYEYFNIQFLDNYFYGKGVPEIGGELIFFFLAGLLFLSLTAGLSAIHLSLKRKQNVNPQY